MKSPLCEKNLHVGALRDKFSVIDIDHKDVPPVGTIWMDLGGKYGTGDSEGL